MEICEVAEVRLPCHFSSEVWTNHCSRLLQYESLTSLSDFELLLVKSQSFTWRQEPCIEYGSIQQALQGVAVEAAELTEQAFLHYLLPWIARKAAEMGQLFPEPMAVSKSGEASTLVLTKVQEVCLMSAFFLCHLPLKHWHFRRDSSAQLKLISIIVYLYKQFQRERVAPGSLLDMCSLEINRRKLTEKKNCDYWRSLNMPLCALRIEQALLIEDHAEPCTRIDFANEYIGGGTLSGGNVQEELYFAIHPELQLTMLFCQVMLWDEVIVVKGAERVTDYAGYGHTAHFKGIHRNSRSDQHVVVAMDAGVFLGRRYLQYEERGILRELNKAYVGFQRSPEHREAGPVVTGNWGCGAFGGDHQFKACLQWMAATAAGRELVYCCFKDKRMEGFEEFARRMEGRTVAELYRVLLRPEVQEQLVGRRSLFELL